MRHKQVQLQRSLSVPMLLLYGLGNILGAGIYVLVGKVAGVADTQTPLAFLIAMGIAGLTALSYMELSSRFPQSAGSALYTYHAFRSRLLSLGVGLAFVLAGITSASALSHGFAGYLGTIMTVDPLIASIAIIVILTGVTLLGIGQSAMMAVIFTLIEAAGLLLIIVLGLPYLPSVPLEQTVTIDSLATLGGVLTGAFLAFYAFIGFEDMVNVAEETRNPRRTMPLAILGALISATVLYMLIVLVCLAAATPDELAQSNAPLAFVLERISSINPAVISVIGMAAALNGIIVQLIMGSRLLYGMAKQGWIPSIFATVEPRRHTPRFSTLIVAGLMLAGVIILPLLSLAKTTSFLALGIFCLVNLSLVIIKRRTPTGKNIIRIPIAIPALASIVSLGMIIQEIL
jgi:basic amino acid/polyamine antiporter, APA family